MEPTVGSIVLYQTDERGGLRYILPAIVSCIQSSHPDYGKDQTNSWQGVESGEVDGSNPVPIPKDAMTVHLTVFTPGAKEVYRELDVEYDGSDNPKARTWHWKVSPNTPN